MPDRSSQDEWQDECREQFNRLVDSVGVKRFSCTLGLSTRQVNRILTGAQANPVERLIRSLQGATAEAGDGVLDYICQEMGGHFVRHECLDAATVNAVKECAEAIAAISDGEMSTLDITEVRQAISALSGLIMSIRTTEGTGRSSPPFPPPTSPPPPPFPES